MLKIDDDLNAQAFYKEKHLIPLSVKKISDVRQIETIILEIDQFSLPLQNLTADILVQNHIENAIRK